MRADAVVLNKVDLLPYTGFDREAFWQGVRRVNPGAARFEVSCRTEAGLSDWYEWFGARLGRRSEV